MITLIIKDNLNIMINEETGRWFCFNSNLEDQVIKNITDDKIKKMYNNYSEFKDLHEEIKLKKEPIKGILNEMNYLILHTTDACNMNCTYCYAKDNIENNIINNDNYMTSDTMIESINKFYNGNNFYVLFHGREPLLNYNNILNTIIKFKDNEKIHFILQTNGLLLDEEKIKVLKKHKVSINISIDGFDDQSNSLRIKNNIINNDTNKIKNIILKNKISPIIILHKKNSKQILKITKELMENNINQAAYNFLWPTKNNKKLTKEVLSNKELIKIMKELIDISVKNSQFVFKERDLYLLYGRILKRHINNYMCNSSPCGAGTNCLSIYKNGEIYPCTMLNNQSENYLGNLKNNVKDIMNSNAEIKNRNINLINDCKECPLRIFCKGGGCPGFIYNYTNNINEKSIYCEYYYEIIIYLIKKIFQISKQKYFINF